MAWLSIRSKRKHVEETDAILPPPVPLPFDQDMPHLQWLPGCVEKFRGKLILDAVMSERLKYANHAGISYLAPRQSNTLCVDFLEGECKFALLCSFAHVSAATGDPTGTYYFETNKGIVRPKKFQYDGFPTSYLEQWKDMGIELWLSYPQLPRVLRKTLRTTR